MIRETVTVRNTLLALAAVLLSGLVALTVWVESETEFRLEALSNQGAQKALVLFHPSRDARFSDDLSIAVARGLTDAGFAVDRATMTGSTPARWPQYRLIAIVTNTYWWTPDRPTSRYLARARFAGVPLMGLIGGAGATGRSQRRFETELKSTGGMLLGVRSYWILRPNDETRLQEPNRALAIQMARQFAFDCGRRVPRP